MSITILEFPELVAAELRDAKKKYSSIVNAHEASAVIREEFAEFWAEVKVKQGAINKSRMLIELVQIAAMCKRAAEDLGLCERRMSYYENLH